MQNKTQRVLSRLSVATLSVVMLLSVCLTGCQPVVNTEDDVTKIEIVTEGLTTTYTQGDTFNYAEVTLTATYESGKTESLNLNSKGVTHNTLNMDEVGEQTLTATYKEKSDSVKINIVKKQEAPKVLISTYELPESYEIYMQSYANDPETPNDDQHRDVFMKGAGAYKVGADNGFVFVPDVRALDVTTAQTITLNEVKTTFKLFEKKAEAFEEVADPSLYLKTESELATESGNAEYTLADNYYFFKQEAIGKTFRLDVTLDESYATQTPELNKTISATVEVIDGYNVYNQIGFSVIDNLNVNHWKAIKEAAGTLAWDTKALTAYNDLTNPESYVETVVLHANLTIDPDQLPENYFWDKDRNLETYGNQGYNSALALLKNHSGANELGYPDKLQGSLRDYYAAGDNDGAYYNFDSDCNGPYKEIYRASAVNMQKGVYVTAGTSISGNCFSIGYTTEGENHSLYSVIAKEADANPVGHWALIKYQEEVHVEESYPDSKEIFNRDPVIENVRIRGNFPRKSETQGEPVQLMAVNTAMDSVTFQNTIVSQLYVGATADHGDGRSNILIENSKFYDIYSNMFYSWRSDIIVKNSVLKDAGGPIFLLCDGNRTGAAHDLPTSGTDTDQGPSLTYDKASQIQSLAAGNEPWYVLNHAEALFTQIKAQQGLFGIAYNYLGLNYIQKNSNNVEQVNVVAAVLCEPGDLMSDCSNAMINTSGLITRTDGEKNESYRINPPMPDLTGTPYAAYNQLIQSLPASNAPFFFSNGLMAIYGAETMNNALHTPIISTAATGFALTTADVKAAWANANDLLFITMRAGATTPRFGVLIGDCVKVGA